MKPSDEGKNRLPAGYEDSCNCQECELANTNNGNGLRLPNFSHNDLIFPCLFTGMRISRRLLDVEGDDNDDRIRMMTRR